MKLMLKTRNRPNMAYLIDLHQKKGVVVKVVRHERFWFTYLADPRF